MSDKKSSAEVETIPFYPDHVRTELWVALGVVAVVLIVGTLGLIFPVGLGAPADPMDTPAHVKPEWYFLALYQVLKYVPKAIGASIPVVLAAVLIIWPFLDRTPDKSSRIIRIRFGVVVVVMVILIGLTIWGEVS